MNKYAAILDPAGVDSCITIQNAVDRKYMKGEPYKPKKLCHTQKKKALGVAPPPLPHPPPPDNLDSHHSACALFGVCAVQERIFLSQREAVFL